MSYKILGIACGLAALSSMAYADESFQSIAGFRLGQECVGSKFKKKQSDVLNPDNSTDKIKVLRNVHESIVAGGHSLYVSCSIIENIVHSIQLSSENEEAISNITSSLQEKMGRPPDEKYNNHFKPQRILGEKMDGHTMDYDYWNLPDNRKATAYTIIILPYNVTSLSQVKWRGGIELSYSDTKVLEWKHLKLRGISSSEEKKASNKKQQVDRIKDLIN